MFLGDVGMQYSLPVMLNAFPVLERKHGSQYQGSLTLHTPLEHEVKSGTHRLRWEEGENSNTTPTTVSQSRRCGDVSLAVMFHAFPVVRRQNTAVNSKDHCTHHWGMWQTVGLTGWGAWEEKQEHNNISNTLYHCGIKLSQFCESAGICESFISQNLDQASNESAV